MNKKLIKALYGIIFAVVSVILTYFLFNLSFFQSLELKAYDALIEARGTRQHTTNVIMVKIDEYTIKELKYPIPRDKFGTLLAILSQSGARVIGVDEIFADVLPDSFSQVQNQQFLLFHNYAPNVIHAIGPFVPSGQTGDGKKAVDPEAYKILHKFSIPSHGLTFPFPNATYIDDRPFDSLANLAVGVGHILLRPDPNDGIIRSVPFFVEYVGDYFPTFGAALVFNFLKIKRNAVTVEKTADGLLVHAGELEIPLTTHGDLLIDFAGTNDVFNQISLQEVLDAYIKGDTQTLGKFKDAVVIIGPTARSIGDHNATPLADISPNCFIHANVYDMLMMNRHIVKVPASSQLIIVAILALIVGVVSITLKLRWSVSIGVLLLAGYIWFAFSAFTNTGVVYALVEPLVAMVFCYASAMTFTTATEGKQKSQIKHMFQKYVDKSVVNQLIENPSLLKLGGEKREITTMFADIEGFTRMSEQMGAENTVQMLNAYLTEMTEIILEEHGTIDKYIGDAIMAFWGAPLDNSDHAYYACRAALRMQKKLQALHTKWIHFGRPIVNQRIGLNTGKAIVGNMGAEARLNYTAIGDPVNLASRLEGVNKEYGTRLLMSEYVYEQVKGKVLAREMDLVIVVGKTEPVRIYELIALADEVQTDATKQFLEYYHAGIDSYKQRAWKSAIEQFQQALTIRRDDVVSNIYIQRSMLFSDNPPPEDWNGVFVMTKK
ncbi:MAG: adenylate/guanylate cyclase domain-containing protein [Bacteroidetes bacterium]|nr:adenylate/guanylate cyclase domain-containing protein [Bacteroidota bacterium]